MVNYEPIVRTFYQKLFEGLADDGINWVEIRSGGSSGKLVHTGQEDVDPNLDVWWDVMIEEIEKFQATEKGKNFWGARVIWSDTRSKNREKITKSMKIALERKQRFPDLFSGYDLVAQEDLGRPLSDLAPELIWFREQTEYLNLTIPFFFHAGETLGDGNSTDYNLVDAILFNSRRIGHGFSLYKHPTLIDEMIEKAVMVEVCPISNEVLRLATDILHHPLPAMIAHGVPTAISNDDPAILGQDIAGLSYDFYQTIQGFDNIGLAGLGALAQNSLRWSNFEDQSDADWLRDIDLAARGDGIKAQRIRYWNQQWEEFCQWIVSEYGDKYPPAEVAQVAN
jgi:adenosine deaminase/adenosine deaminase CECR1